MSGQRRNGQRLMASSAHQRARPPRWPLATTHWPLSSPAFTLVEIMLAILLMGLLAAAASFTFADPIRAARTREAVEQVKSFDPAVRQYAQLSGHDVRVIFDMYEDTIHCADGTQTPFSASLPRGFRIDQVRAADGRRSDGRIEIPLSRLGLSRSYAVRLVGPSFEKWFLIAGLGGEVTQVADESSLDSIFAPIAAPGTRPR